MKENRVEIYGQSYAIGGDIEPAYLEKLARTVDTTMRALAARTDTLDSRRLAVLAALNLADEVEQLKEKLVQEHEALPREFAARVEACARQLDSALGDERAR
jgi:cell division protein ZapA